MTKEEVYYFVKNSLAGNYLTYNEFEKIFWFQSQKEQYATIELLLELKIELVDQVPQNIEKTGKNDSGNAISTDDLDLDIEINLDDMFLDDDREDEKTDEKYVEILPVKKHVTQSNYTLCKLIQEGNKQAELDLCVRNERLVYKYANAYHKLYGNTLEIEDLVQVGMVGMLIAAKKFNFDMGTEFSTYATYWIKQTIAREIMDHGFVVRLPVHVMEKIAKVSKLDNRYVAQGYDYEKRKELIANDLDVTVEKVSEFFKIRNEYLSVRSLDVPVGEDESTPLSDFVADKNSLSVEESVEQIMLRKHLDEILADLKERERDIIILRFGLEDGRPKTLEEIGKMYNLTRERIRQIEAKALRKLRNPVRSKIIKDYLY